MNGIADVCGWLSGNNGNGHEPVGGISLNLVSINPRHGNTLIPEKATGILPIVQFYQGQSPPTVLNKQATLSFRIIFGRLIA
jgi:hypothetical protein